MKSQALTAIALAAILFAATSRISSAANSRSQSLPQQSSSGGSAAQARQDAGSSAAPEQGTVPLRLPKGKKLMLADGTFLLVREYSMEGDRVRYWSVERSAWEEIPAKLVDWDATRKAEADLAQQDAELKAKIHATDIAERTQGIDVDRSLEIKPGLFLPDDVGFYSLENKLIHEMKQSQAVAKRSVGREMGKILAGGAIPSEEILEIPDDHAALRFAIGDPEFYMRPADQREPHFRLLRLKAGAGHRVVETTNLHLSGEKVQYATDVEFQTWTPARGVYRYTFEPPLDPGEYAFVEMTSDGISGYVWDFGIDLPRSKTKK